MIKQNTDTAPNRGLLEMTIAMLISGTIGITLLWTGQKLTDVIFFRCLLGAMVIGGICWARGLFAQIPLTRVFWVATLIGGIALCVNWLLLFSAYGKTSIGIATTVYNTQPFMLVLICAVVFKERITRQIAFWLVVSFVGLCCISASKIDSSATYDNYLLGILQALGAAFLYAIISVCAKYLKAYSATLIAFFQLLLGTVVFLPLTDFSHLWQTLNLQSASAMMTLGIVHTGVMYILLYGAIQKLPAYQVASLSFLYPAVALLIDFAVLDVRLAWVQIIGILLILAGAAGNNLRGMVVRKNS